LPETPHIMLQVNFFHGLDISGSWRSGHSGGVRRTVPSSIPGAYLQRSPIARSDRIIQDRRLAFRNENATGIVGAFKISLLLTRVKAPTPFAATGGGPLKLNILDEKAWKPVR